jgi:hypothetical protein
MAHFILTEPEKYPVFSWVYEWLNILTFEKLCTVGRTGIYACGEF